MTEQEPSAPETQPPVVGLVAEFQTPEALIQAARRVREEGYQKTDAFAPFPVHGLDEALGIRATRLPWLVLLAGVTGGIVALLGQWWTNAVDYPYVVSGKPLFSLPANIPVIFELIILFSAFGAFLGMLAFNRLPNLSNPLFASTRFLRVTSDRFFLMIHAADPKFAEDRTRDFLDSLGAADVEECRADSRSHRLPPITSAVLLVLACLALIPPLLIAKARVTTSDKPRWHTFTDMDYQPRFRPQTQAPLAVFADRRSARPPVRGTVARGQLYADDRLYRGIDPDAPPPEAAPADTPPAKAPPAKEPPADGNQTSAASTAAEPAEDPPSSAGEGQAAPPPPSDADLARPNEEPRSAEGQSEGTAADTPDASAGKTDASKAEPAKAKSAKPQSSKPDDAKPDDAKPDDAKPDDAKPDDAKPQSIKPQADAKPAAEAKPQPAADAEPQPAWVTEFPLPVSLELMQRGQQRFNIYCAPCHGRGGEGDGIVSKSALALEQGTWVPPLSLHAESVVEQPVGQIYSTITFGVRKMPAYADQIAVQDRWAIVLYVRALQRSRNARPSDVPAEILDTLRDL